MTDSLSSILSKKEFDEPPELATVKKFVKDKFNAAVGVSVGQNRIIISVPNSAMASSLRFSIHELESLLPSKSRISIRIGQ